MVSYLSGLLQAQERALHQAETRQSHVALSALFHPEFEEIGRSGRRYDRADVLRDLPMEAPSAIVASGFRLVQLAPDMALLHYQSHGVTAGGGPGEATLRTSLWQCVDGQWLLRFHQGTPQALE